MNVCRIRLIVPGPRRGNRVSSSWRRMLRSSPAWIIFRRAVRCGRTTRRAMCSCHINFSSRGDDIFVKVREKFGLTCEEFSS